MTGRSAAVLGAGGMLAHELISALHSHGWRVRGSTHAECDITDPAAVEHAIDGVAVVFNCAAYTLVDRSEREPESAFAVNADGARVVAAGVAKSGATLVHISTNAVFDGTLDRPYREDDPTSPVGVYGASKLAGEEAVRLSGARAYIVRSGHLYGDHGWNFFRKIAAQLQEGLVPRIVSDQIVSPTWTRELAGQLLKLVDAAPPGTYHAMALGETSWYDAAVEMLRLSGGAVTIEPISMRDFPSTTPRARNSILANEAAARLGVMTMRPWRDALADWCRETGP